MDLFLRKKKSSVTNYSIKYPNRGNSSRNNNVATKKKAISSHPSPVLDGAGLGCRVSIPKGVSLPPSVFRTQKLFKT